MNREELREAIKTAKQALSSAVSTLLIQQRQAILNIITTAEQVLEAGSELPEKRKETGTSTQYCRDEEGNIEGSFEVPCSYPCAKSFNEAISLCLPKLALYKAMLKASDDSLTLANERIAELATLCDGASIAVELFNATTPAQIEWKKKWLDNFKEEKRSVL
jgi:hypothetical protein